MERIARICMYAKGPRILWLQKQSLSIRYWIYNHPGLILPPDSQRTPKRVFYREYRGRVPAPRQKAWAYGPTSVSGAKTATSTNRSIIGYTLSISRYTVQFHNPPTGHMIFFTKLSCRIPRAKKHAGPRSCVCIHGETEITRK